MSYVDWRSFAQYPGAQLRVARWSDRRGGSRWRGLAAILAHGAAALSFQGIAAAQQSESEGPVTDVVVTGSRSPESSQRAVVPTRIVTREDAEREGAVTVADALSNQLGVQINPSSYDHLGNPSGIQIQGFDGERVLILLDGERIIGDTGGMIDLESLPLTEVQRIEFVTGPTSSLYGTGAIGGVVNIITGPPRHEGASLRGRYEVRTFGAHTEQATAAFRSGDLWALVDGSYSYSWNEVRDDGSTWIPESKRYLLGVRVGAQVTDAWESRVKLRYVRDDTEGLIVQRRPGLPPFYLETPEITDRYSASTQQVLNISNASQLRLTMGTQWFDNSSIKQYRGSEVSQRRNREHIMQSFEAISTTREGDRSWTFGARAETESFGQQQHNINVSPNSGITHDFIDEVFPQSFGSMSLYSQLDWRLSNKVSLLPGVRGEWHSRYGLVAAPRFAMSYRPEAKWIFRGAVGRGFRVPSAKEYGFAFDHSSLGYMVIGNPDLKPESSWGVTAEAQWRPDLNWRIRAGGFVNWVDGLIANEFGHRNMETQIDVYTYGNVGTAQTWGSEVDVEVRLFPELRSNIGYSYLGTRAVSVGANGEDEVLPLAGRPPYTFKTSLTWDPTKRLKLNLRYRMVSEAFVTKGVTSPAFAMVGARAAYSLSNELEAYVGVDNALNAQRQLSRVGDQRPMRGAVIFTGLNFGLPEL